MATTYLELTNQVLEDLRYNPTSETDFPIPSKEEVRIVKRLLNEAKDEVLPRIGLDLVERRFAFEALNPYLAAAYPSVTATVDGQAFSTAPTDVFLNDVTGWKVLAPHVIYADPNSTISGTGPTDATPHTVINHLFGSLLQVETVWDDPSGSAKTATDWAVYQDEFDLDASVRQVLHASSSEGPLELVLVDWTQLQKLRENRVEFGTPQYAYLFRSETDQMIWRIQLVPAPSRRLLVQYRASARLADLSVASDYWNLEPEIERMVKDRAVYRALSTPIKNDLEMAGMRRADLRERVQDWQDAYAPVAAGRRLRRQGPDELASTTLTDRFNYQIENP